MTAYCGDNCPLYTPDYPLDLSQKSNYVDIYHDERNKPIKIEDPYRLFEKTQSKETLRWIDKQHDLLRGFLKRNKGFDKKLSKVVSKYGFVGGPTSVSIKMTDKWNRTYFEVDNPKWGGHVLRRYKTPDYSLSLEDFDENTEHYFNFSVIPKLGEHEELQEVYFSDTLSRYLPFSFNKGGSDWQTIRILDL